MGGYRWPCQCSCFLLCYLCICWRVFCWHHCWHQSLQFISVQSALGILEKTVNHCNFYFWLWYFRGGFFFSSWIKTLQFFFFFICLSDPQIDIPQIYLHISPSSGADMTVVMSSCMFSSCSKLCHNGWDSCFIPLNMCVQAVRRDGQCLLRPGQCRSPTPA